MTFLPIDQHLAAIAAALGRGNVIIEAEPGAGKTTRVPPALLAMHDQQIWVTEPRRLAARLAARRVAAERSETVGQTCGYQVRYEKQVGEDTRIRFVTEGILLRRMAQDPLLRGIGTLVLDEVHERHLDTDLGLALATRLQRGERPDLRIAAMSATLDAAPLAALLDAETIRCEGRRFDVSIEYLPRPRDRALDVHVRAAVRSLLDDRGHILVFLPGAAQIRRAAHALAELAPSRDLEITRLHGDMPPAEQDRAVDPSGRRKVILSTNVAESSVTIEGVGAVIDSGLARESWFSPWTGLRELRLGAISRASADQRAGRAGRTAAGRCIRLYAEHDHQTRAEHAAPEIQRADLASAVLLLRCLGVEPAELPWLEAPPAASIEAAIALLRALGALGDLGQLTDVGRRLGAMPLHPRLARLVDDANERGVGRDAAAAAALLSERDPRPRGHGGLPVATVSGASDVSDWVDRWRDRREIDRRAAHAADRLVRSMAHRLRQDADLADDERELRLRRAVLAGFPDRVGKRRPDSNEIVLAGGGSARLSDASVVRSESLVVVPRAERKANVTIADAVSAIEIDWLIDQCADQIADDSRIELDADTERVVVLSRLRIGKVILDESRRPPNASEADQAAVVLADAIWTSASRRAALIDARGLDAWLGRVEFARQAAPDLDLPAVDDDALRAAVASLCAGRTSISELRRVDVLSELRAHVLGGREHVVSQLAPDRVELLGGRKARVHYEVGKPPWIESRLQDFFGMTTTPTIAGGRVPLTLHLLAPNQRAVQVTSDLAGFWTHHYPAIKKQLERRYPRHAWPEDPTVVQASMRPRKRR